MNGLIRSQKDAAIAELTQKVEEMRTDYIVAQGTSGIWTYRKWNSGVAECWGETSRSFNFTGSGLIESEEEFMPTNYPFIFLSVPKELVSLVAEDSVDGILCSYKSNNLDLSGSYYVLRKSAKNNIKYKLLIYVAGRWK